MKKIDFYQKHYHLPTNYINSSDRYKKLKQLILKLKPKKFLDLGCGDGSFMKYVCGKKIEYWGLDIVTRNNNSRILNCDIDNDTVPKKIGRNFDVVFAGEILEHVYDPELMLEKLRRLLNKNGSIIITTPNLAAWYNRLSLLIGYQPFFSGVGLRGTY